MAVEAAAAASGCTAIVVAETSFWAPQGLWDLALHGQWGGRCRASWGGAPPKDAQPRLYITIVVFAVIRVITAAKLLREGSGQHRDKIETAIQWPSFRMI